MEVGDKIKGFKFDGVFVPAMEQHIGEVGNIVMLTEGRVVVEFPSNFKRWSYPFEEAKKHLVEEWVIGEEYEFRDGSEKWSRPRKLIGIVDHKYKYIVEGLGYQLVGFKQIRKIEKPSRLEELINQLKEEAAKEDFDVDIVFNSKSKTK